MKNVPLSGAFATRLEFAVVGATISRTSATGMEVRHIFTHTRTQDTGIARGAMLDEFIRSTVVVQKACSL